MPPAPPDSSAAPVITWDTVAPVREIHDLKEKKRKTCPAEPRRAGAGAQRAGPCAAEVAPPRPGTVAPGANSTMDSATANGDDRDPEIELFVKVGRRPGAAAPAVPGAGLTCPGADRCGTRAGGLSGGQDLVPGAPGQHGARDNLTGGGLLGKVARGFVKSAAGTSVAAGVGSAAAVHLGLVQEDVLGCRETAGARKDE